MAAGILILLFNVSLCIEVDELCSHNTTINSQLKSLSVVLNDSMSLAMLQIKNYLHHCTRLLILLILILQLLS